MSFAASAQTAPPSGVGIYLSNAVVGTYGYVGDGNSSYATGPGVSIYNSGGTQIDGNPLYGLTSVPLAVGATTGTLSSYGSSGQSGGRFAQVTATADLSGGVLRASAVGSSTTGSYDPVGPGAGRGIAGASMRDNLSFQVLGGGTADITVTAHLDGFFAFNDPYYGSASQAMALGIGGAGFSEVGGESDANGGTSYRGHNGASGNGPPSGWVSYSFSNETDSGFDFTGIFEVSDGQRSAVNLNLTTDCSGATCGFDHTATIGIVLPDNVTFTSDSGVFLTSGDAVTPVPEPETWTLLLAGLGVLSWVFRRNASA